MLSSDTAIADVQSTLAQAVKDYAALVQSGDRCRPFPAESGVTATDVVVACSSMLRAVDVEIFELAMWEIFGGT